MTRRPRHAGLTLLELLVSMAILASIVTLTAAIWSQARAWADESEGHANIAGPAQVGEMLENQWMMRRMTAHLDVADGPAVRLSPDRLEFITGSAALDLRAGLVRASYIVETSDDAGVALVYEERPLRDPAVSVIPESGVGLETVSRRSILPDCESARWERLVEWTESTADGGPPVTHRVWTVAARPEGVDGPSENEPTGREVAYRLIGQSQGRWFEWVLVGADSR